MYRKATYHGVPCWYDSETSRIHGRNLIFHWLVLLNIWLDEKVFCTDGFEIWVDEDE